MSRLLPTVFLTLCLGLPGVGSGQQPTLVEREWQDISSPNFRIMSVLGQERTVELLHHLEIMRASLGDVSEEPTYRSGVPTVIVAVDNHDDYVSIGAPDFSAGFFISNLRENAILINDTDDAAGIQIVLHEYAHYLNKQSGRIRYPRWFEEGNAEYLSHSRVADQAFEFAVAPQRHLAALNFSDWLPLRRILEVADLTGLSEEDAALFYGQSWLLVHYLRSLPDADRTIGKTLGAYSRLASKGVAPVDAFEQAFGFDVAQLEQELLQYYLDDNFITRRIAVNTTLPGFATRIKEMSEADAALALGQMALRFENSMAAEAWFTEVLADNEQRAHAEAGLGRVKGQRGDIEAASEHFENAIYLMAWDFWIWMDYAQYWAERLAVSQDNKSRQKVASRLIESLESALTISEATPELNSLMGFAYLAKGEDINEAIGYLEAAAEAAPHDQASRLLLARAYIFAYQPDDAIAMAESVLQFEHRANTITAAARDVISDARELDGLLREHSGN